jgi:hypothetical protein
MVCPDEEVRLPNNVIISLTRAATGREQEFEAWFDEHLSEVLQVEGVVSARRFALAADQLDGTPVSAHQYLAIYEISEDVARIWIDLQARRDNGLNVPKRGIDEDSMRIWAFDETTSLVSGD